MVVIIICVIILIITAAIITGILAGIKKKNSEISFREAMDLAELPVITFIMAIKR